MVAAISVALSGLMAQSQRLAVSANNIANISTAGTLPTLSSPASTVYRPLSVSQIALIAGNSGAGVTTVVTENPDKYLPVYSPDSIYANKDGLIAVPDVDLGKEFSDILVTKIAYKANVAIIKAQNEMQDDLFDALV